MRTQTAPITRLKDYIPPAYTIRTVELKVALDPKATQIRSIICVERQKGTKSDSPLILDGDELNLVSLKVDGEDVDEESYKVSPDQLVLTKPPKSKTFSVEIVTEVSPSKNTKLMGLYQSSGVYCTQCEAEGFRRITYFLDRPDVLATYTVRVEGDRDTCPVLLSNGNRIKAGKLANNRHFATWHDPHPKPSYLFALVGGKLDVLADKFTTASGKKVKLNIYVEQGKAAKAAYAMDALKRSMKWDEEQYGREYDLDIFNIVAVSDFNMGAMENKGLNIFNDKFVLADPDVATDADYMNIEAIIAHEYFHNWTGNRITCRDWFQLCLKEGLTVYRDHEFSADERSRAVQRIMQVRNLKAIQFPEDAGPMAHSVRPDKYQEINNFYTATVYQKGAELVRMLATIVGSKAYRKSTDMYFKRHDGKAAVVEDWLGSFETAARIDLTQFSRWYGQAGTPIVEVTQQFDKAKQQFKLTLEQSVPPTPGQKRKHIVPIPVRFGLLSKTGEELAVDTNSKAVQGDLILLDKKRISITFKGHATAPVPSLLRSFSAPVNLKFRETKSAKIVRAEFDTDLYNRFEALNSYALETLLRHSRQKKPARKIVFDSKLISAMLTATYDEELEPAFRAQILALPSERDIAFARGKNVDPDAIHKTREQLVKTLGQSFGKEGLQLIQSLRESLKSASDMEATGLRSLSNGLLAYLVSGAVPGALKLTQNQYASAKNMTDRLAALAILLHCQTDESLSDKALKKFYKAYSDNPLVLDKWFSIQAIYPGKNGLKHVQELTKHSKFSIENPNRARSLLAMFASTNLSGFHRADGRSYKFFAKQILAIDKINPQLAARMLTSMNNWKMFDKTRMKQAKLALQTIAAAQHLSRDTKEIVNHSLK